MNFHGIDRIGRWLGGAEEVAESGLPVEEFAHPWPLLAMALLGVNDHVLKGSGWVPGWLTGKLSDFAGLFFFPLFITAAVDTVLYVAHRVSRGRTPGYSLRMWKLYAAVAFTALLFVPLQLSETWKDVYIRAMHALDVFDWFGHFQVTMDPTDLVAVAVFPLVILFGRRFVRRVPMGRLVELRARARRRPAGDAHELVTGGLSDVRGTLRHRHQSAALDAFGKAFAASLSPKAKAKAGERAQAKLDDYRRALERAE